MEPPNNPLVSQAVKGVIFFGGGSNFFGSSRGSGKELKLSYYNQETLRFTVYAHLMLT